MKRLDPLFGLLRVGPLPWVFGAEAECEPFEEIAQELIAAGHVVLVGRGAKERSDFTFGYGEARDFHGGDHVGVLHFEGDS